MGWSSPVILDGQVWMTTASSDGYRMYAVCTDLRSGKILHDLNVFSPGNVFQKHDINSYATPTPCIEKGYVYVHFGGYGTACLSTADGKVIWKRTDLECNHVQGPGSSPMLFKDLLILHYEGTDVQYIIALDKSTGKTVWRTDRPADVLEKLSPIGRKAYVTPIVINVNGREMLISNGSATCNAYDVASGKEIWRFIRGEDSTIAMPFFEDGILYFNTSFITGEGERYSELIALDPKGNGDITETNVIWRIKTPILQLSTPLIKDGLIYMVDTQSTLMCLDAKTGATIWSKRMKGKFNSSPIYAAGNIYFSSTDGKTLVIREGKELQILAENTLEGEIWATPAIVDGGLLIRTSEYLYRIGQ
jgi:outer membrane protein assembly factor BamB